MQTRSEKVDDFLIRSGWRSAHRSKLAGDASFRKYERVISGDKRAVLMDAPPEKEDTGPFIRIGRHLVAKGFSAPEIYAEDGENGFLLLEDLGDDLFARILERSPEKEEELYRAAADVLIALRLMPSDPPLELPVYDMSRFISQVALFGEWFLPLFLPKEEASMLNAEYIHIWKKLLQTLPDLGRVLVLYDYHAENLLWLPDRSAVKRAGLLDFQDAVWGSPAYDMVSLLKDARRDVSLDVERATLDYYIDRTGVASDAFKATCVLLGAQRNCRILGTFVRLAQRDGKRQYLDYMPRVWRHLEDDLRHPLLAPLKTWMDKTVPHVRRKVTDVVHPFTASA